MPQKETNHSIDATDKTLGRLATHVATLLMGKHKPAYTPHKDVGDAVFLTNVSHIRVTGGKAEKKMYYHASGYPGGLKKRLMKSVSPEQQLYKAVWNMLPKNKLRQQRMKRLHMSP